MTMNSRYSGFFLLVAFVGLPASVSPAPINVAASSNGGVATQTTTFLLEPQFGPEFAIDGNTDGLRWPNNGTIQRMSKSAIWTS